jgi:hypothetical protein
MKAIRYKDETMGAEYVVDEIPADMLDEAKAYREQLIEKVSEADDKLLEKYLHGEELTEDEIKAALRKRVITSVHTPASAPSRRSCRSSAGRPSRTRASSRCSTPWSTTCRRRSTCRPSPASIPTRGRRARRAQGGRRRAVLGAGVQDHDRPVRRPADVHPRVLGRHDAGS